MKQSLLALVVISGIVGVPSAFGDVTVPIDPQFIRDVRAGQGEPPTNATDEQLMAQGLSICANITKQSGVVDATTGLPVFNRPEIRGSEVAPQFEALEGPIFDAAVTYLCPDARSNVPR